MVRKINILILYSIVLLLGACQQGDKTGFINLGTVYSEFSLSVKLDKERETVVNMRQKILDSLQIELNLLSDKLKYSVEEETARIFQQKRDEYYYKERQFSEDNEALLAKYNEQIMKQLNQYIEDYGKEHGYTYIYGATGNGSLMYAEENSDISKDVISSINDKYSGVK